MYDDRDDRRYLRYRNPMRGLATGIFIIGLAFAFYFRANLDGTRFYPFCSQGGHSFRCFLLPAQVIRKVSLVDYTALPG